MFCLKSLKFSIIIRCNLFKVGTHRITYQLQRVGFTLGGTLLSQILTSVKVVLYVRGVLDSVNSGCFVSSRCQHFLCNAMRTSIKARMNWHQIQQIEQTPELNCLLMFIAYLFL